jgi:hypothetical protein
MKTLFFTQDQLIDTVDYIIEMNQVEEPDILDELIASRTDRMAVIYDFKNAVSIWYFHIRYALVIEDYKLAERIKKVVKIEKENSLKILDLLGTTEENDEFLFDQIAHEANFIITQPISI